MMRRILTLFAAGIALAVHTKEQVEVWKTAVRDSGMALE